MSTLVELDLEIRPSKEFPGRVLFVDDEPMATRTLEGVAGLDEALVASAFNDATEALAYIRENEVDTIVSDFVMPGMNGLELLAEARRIRPEASRILLTGYADKQSAIRSINEIGLFHYIEKPWDNPALLLVLRNAVERARLLRLLRSRGDSLDRMRDRLWKMLV